MAGFKTAVRQWSLALALPLACSASAQAEDPVLESAPPAKPQKVRLAGGAHAQKLEMKKPGASNAQPGETGAARKAAVAKLREQSQDAREGDRAAMREAKDQAREGKPEIGEALHGDHPHARHAGKDRAGKDAPNEAAERGRRMRSTLWRGMAHRVQHPSQIPAEVRAELANHGRRLARLYRIRRLAQEQADKDALDRANKLVARELARHRKQLVVHWQAHMQNKPGAAPGEGDKLAAQAAEEEDQAEVPPDELEDEDEDEEEGAER